MFGSGKEPTAATKFITESNAKVPKLVFYKLCCPGLEVFLFSGSNYGERRNKHGSQADYKFGNDECARRLARVENYVNIVRENLLWTRDHSERIVRHLLMPGHIDCCWSRVAVWLAVEMPGVKVNLRSGFWPAWHAKKHAELHGVVSDEENRRALL